MNSLDQDLIQLGIECCISGDSSPLQTIEYSDRIEDGGGHHEQQPVPPAMPQAKKSWIPKRTRLSSRMTSSLKSSFTKNGLSKSIGSSIPKGMSHHYSPNGAMSASMAAQLVFEEYFSEEDANILSMPSLLDTKDGDEMDEIETATVSCQIDYQNVNMNPSDHQDTATTCCSESRHSIQPSLEDALALEVGMSAHEYLEECFYTEVSVLDRDKFNAIPEIIKTDFTVLSHLGKGNFSDVFEVVSKGKRATTSISLNTGSNSPPHPPRRRGPRARRSTLSSSMTTATLSRPFNLNKPQNTFALKCLRPQIRSDADQFTIGAEDLVHETAILASLDHRHIIKLHGRASGHLSDAFVLNDGYFILLDKLDKTLSDRIAQWRCNSRCTVQGPQQSQMEVAHSIADAMCYLHSKNIIFRDLKPANVGFDSQGVLKLFDFGFAAGLPEPSDVNPRGLLSDRCGTPRYMAPEVGLSVGYALPADVYSFGIILWEICALSKPFVDIKSSAEFDYRVFSQGERPPVQGHWPATMVELMTECWNALPSRRPSMMDVKSTMSLQIFNGDHEAAKVSAKVVKSRLTRRLSSVGY